MKPAALFLLAMFLAGPQFEVTDERGKKPPGVTIEAGESDADGWFALKVVKGQKRGRSRSDLAVRRHDETPRRAGDRDSAGQ